MSFQSANSNIQVNKEPVVRTEAIPTNTIPVFNDSNNLVSSNVPISSIHTNDATTFVPGVTDSYFKNQMTVGDLLTWSFASGVTGWSSGGAGTTWALSGSYLQCSGGGGASDYTNFYRYDSYPFVANNQQVEILNFIASVNATNAGEGLGLGIKTNDGVLDFLVKVDLSNTASRGQISIYNIISGTPTLVVSSSTNATTPTSVAFTTNVDLLSLKITKKTDGRISAKLLNVTTGNSVQVVTTSAVAAGVSRTSKVALYHFGGTQRIPTVNYRNVSPKSKATIFIGDSIMNGCSYNGLMDQSFGSAFLYAASGATTTDIVNSLPEIINSGALRAVIMIGGNDASNSVSTASYMANMRIIINALDEAGICPIICYVKPTTDGTKNGFIQGYNTAITTEYTNVYPIITETYSAVSVGNNLTGALQPGYDSGDGTHLTTAGYQLEVRVIQNGAYTGLAGTPQPALLNPSKSCDIQTFNVGTFTWVKPARAKSVYVLCISGGGGGGSGRKSATGILATGGGGGAGGSQAFYTFDASLVPASVTVVVGAGGAGGASVTTNSTDGNPGGTTGSRTSFGTLLTSSTQSAAAAGGNSTGAAAGGTNNTSMFIGANGAGSSATGGTGTAGTSSSSASPSGGSGGGITTANVAAAGGAGAVPAMVGNATVPAAGAVNNPGTNGATFGLLATSGAGGGASTTGNAGKGGDGGNYGAGGGGGGAARDGVGNSGAGGKGGDGVCVVITYF